MGMFKKKIKVSNKNDSSKFFEAEFWIDTGAMYSFVPEDYLEKIGFEPSETRTMVFADGRVGRCPFGYCNFEIEGFDAINVCPVVAGTMGSMFLLGATALGNFGVEADPVNEKLNPVLAIIWGYVGSKNRSPECPNLNILWVFRDGI
jgi:predicted aspartyl protease